MKKLTNTSGFTLLEIIIVIIIVGVLASLALPRFFATVEFSRSTEAFSSLTAIRGALERCYLQKSGTYSGCDDFDDLDIDDPALAPNSHFSYSIQSTSDTGYQIRATRNSTDGGTTDSYIQVDQTSTLVTRSGSGAFENI